MDIFKFNNPNELTKMEDAEIINGFTSKMWIERYLKEGEFTLVAPADAGIREKLPIGSFISHVNSTEIMIVESHEINASEGQESEIKVTGRGFETFFENRIVGSNKSFPVSGILTNYAIAADYTWNQAVELINDHILVSRLFDYNYVLPYISVLTTILESGVAVARTTPPNTLYAVLMQLLAIDNLGIKVIRPGPWSIIPDTPDVVIVIHRGVNRSNQIVFSYDTGEITNADYLWSNKKSRNAAFISGKWVQAIYNPEEAGYERRMMFVDASDIDQDLQAAPTGAELDIIVASMIQRGTEALASSNNVALTKAEVSKEHLRSVYRKDFDVGDLVAVQGDYNENSVMRISEYVEIEDENGEGGYPTLTVDY